MKIDKEMQKKLFNKISELAKLDNFKLVQNALYKKQDDLFICVHYLIVESRYLVFRVTIKKYIYDNIFWDIMRMEKNVLCRDSLRAIGAFSAPTVLVDKGKWEVSGDIQETAEKFMNWVNDKYSQFIDATDLNEYVLSEENITDRYILKCLALIDMNQSDMAIDVAKQQIALDENGRFVNEGKGFFELLVERIQT